MVTEGLKVFPNSVKLNNIYADYLVEQDIHINVDYEHYHYQSYRLYNQMPHDILYTTFDCSR